MYQIHLDHSFDAAHRVVGHKGKCARLHGHTYSVAVQMGVNKLADPGFVVDFGDIKDEVNRWDHRTLLWDRDPMLITSGPPVIQLSDEMSEMQLERMRSEVVIAQKAMKPLILEPGMEFRGSLVNEGDLGIVRLPFNPTSENMSRALCEALAVPLRKQGEAGWVNVRLSETPKSSSTWEVTW